MLDTLEIAERLKAAGLGEREAKQIATELRKALEDAEIVTRPILQAELAKVKVEIVMWVLFSGAAQIVAGFLHK
jgi:hypothetical protein